MTDQQHSQLVAAHLLGTATAEEFRLLEADPVRWRAALIRLGGAVNARISELNPVVKRLNTEANERARVDAMRRRVLETVQPEHRDPEVHYVRRGAR